MRKTFKCAVKGCKERWTTDFAEYVRDLFFCPKHFDINWKTSEPYPGAWRDEEQFAYNHGLDKEGDL